MLRGSEALTYLAVWYDNEEQHVGLLWLGHVWDALGAWTPQDWEQYWRDKPRVHPDVIVLPVPTSLVLDGPFFTNPSLVKELEDMLRRREVLPENVIRPTGEAIPTDLDEAPYTRPPIIYGVTGPRRVW
jgi:hypothetical protein